MNKSIYSAIKRLMAVIVAILLWGMSMKFSVDGFGIGDPKDRWMGWVLAFAVTMIELIWNGMKMKSNLTLIVLGICAYLYGIVTNVLGIYSWRGGNVSEVEIMTLIFSVVLGLLLEIAPEPLLVWGILNISDEGDFLGNIFQSGSETEQEGHKEDHKPYAPYTPPIRPVSAYKPPKRPNFPSRF